MRPFDSFKELLDTGCAQIMLWHFTKRENRASQTCQLPGFRQNGNIKLWVCPQGSQRPVGPLHPVLLKYGHE